MPVEIREVVSKKDGQQFVDLQFEIYKNSPLWVPPLKKDELKYLFPDTNPAFGFCEAKSWLAYKNGKCSGRISAIINKNYNEKTGIPMGRFSRLEMIDDDEVSETLLSTAENWIKSKGMIGVHGPLGFTNLDTQGLLIEGFDHLPSIASVYHLPYYQKHIERYGYEKEEDWIEFRLTVGEIPERGLKMNEMLKERNGLSVLPVSSSKDLLPFADRIFHILNKAFSDLPYVSPLNPQMIEYYKNKYFSFINPRFVKLVSNKENEVIGFIIAVPSLSEAMQKARGSLFPLGFYHILQAMKKPKVVDLMLTGVLPESQGTGAPAIFFVELQKELLASGVKYMETTGMFENNTKATTFWKSYEHIQHKRRRCFKKMF